MPAVGILEMVMIRSQQPISCRITDAIVSRFSRPVYSESVIARVVPRWSLDITVNQFQGKGSGYPLESETQLNKHYKRPLK